MKSLLHTFFVCLCVVLATNSSIASEVDATHTVQVVQTAQNTQDRLTPKPNILFSNNRTAGITTISLDVNTRYQKILGFGGAFTEAAASTYALLTPQLKQQFLSLVYQKGTGLNYNVGRTHINSCDFSVATYSFDDVAGDYGLAHFNYSHNLKWMIPFIKDALNATGNAENFHLFATPWSPPAWMKGNGAMDGSSQPGLIDSQEVHRSWAHFISKYITLTQQALGIKLWGLTVQNEPEFAAPWEACCYTPEQERDFVRDYLGPRLHEDHPHVNIMIYDHNKDHVVEWAQTVYSDPAAAKYVAGTAFHWYSGPQFENVQKAHDLFPNKFLLATEACNCPPKFDNWQYAEAYGYDILGDLNAWTVGWTDWNVLLNKQGGPNHLNNYCSAHIHADTANQQLLVQPSYYYMGQISKFVLPHSYRIGTTVTQVGTQTLSISAFLTPQNRIVVVVMNQNDTPVTFQLQVRNQYAKYAMLAHSIVTFSFSNF